MPLRARTACCYYDSCLLMVPGTIPHDVPSLTRRPPSWKGSSTLPSSPLPFPPPHTHAAPRAHPRGRGRRHGKTKRVSTKRDAERRAPSAPTPTVTRRGWCAFRRRRERRRARYGNGKSSGVIHVHEGERCAMEGRKGKRGKGALLARHRRGRRAATTRGGEHIH